jgi:predicted Rossmann fold flavoprotein
LSDHKIIDLIVVGGGAAGFFGAINAARQNPKLKILILEKSPKLLSKVKISGGGRCNVTHHCFEPTPLSQHYPRGQKQLKKLFRTFDAKNTVDWFEKLGIHLKTEDDGRMFPITDNSQTIIDSFLSEAKKFNIRIETNCEVEKLSWENNHFLISASRDQIFHTRKVLIAMGGHPQSSHYKWIENLGHTINPLIPSLFTFNDVDKKFTDLMGIAVADAEVKIATTKLSERGAVLITHWGLSGPAVIKLSAWAAEFLHQRNYTFTALVNWTGKLGEDEVRAIFQTHKSEHGKQKIFTNPFFGLPQRLWERLAELSEIDKMKLWGDASNKDIYKLIEYLIRCPFHIKGKTTFKEEFVTCGGVNLNEIDLETMQSKKMPGLYFAGEVLNLDGETGGFNFQAAWTTSYIAALSIAKDKIG